MVTGVEVSQLEGSEHALEAIPWRDRGTKAETRRAKADQMASDIQARLVQIEVEVKSIHARAEVEGERQKRELIAVAEAEAAKILASARNEVDNRVKHARHELTEYAGQLASERAEEDDALDHSHETGGKAHSLERVAGVVEAAHLATRPLCQGPGSLTGAVGAPAPDDHGKAGGGEASETGARSRDSGVASWWRAVSEARRSSGWPRTDSIPIARAP